uniref:Retrotransposon gag domain-containing protein n=1 Tax=Clytia hemisphaerica TaxID=252671 RepID=A0A7M5XD80_9CNID
MTNIFKMNVIQMTLDDIPQFHGTSNENIKSYFESFESIATIGKWSSKERLNVLTAYGLQGHAMHYYRALPADVKPSYKLIKEMLLNYFWSSDIRMLKKAELAKLKQEECSSLDIYLEKLEELVYQLNYSNEQKLDSLIAGLNDDLRISVILKRFKTFNEAVAYIRLENAIKPNYNVNSTKLFKELNEKIDKLAAGACTVQFSGATPRRVSLNEYAGERDLDEQVSEVIEQKLRMIMPQTINTLGRPKFASSTDGMREIERMQAKIKNLKRQRNRLPQQNRRISLDGRRYTSTRTPVKDQDPREPPKIYPPPNITYRPPTIIRQPRKTFIQPPKL